MNDLLTIIEKTAQTEKDKTDDKELEAEFQEILDFVSDIKAIEDRANALSLSLDLFSGTPHEKESIEAKIYALKVILNLLSFKAEKLNA